MFRRMMLRAAQRLVLQPYQRQTRGMTLGTRTLVIRGDGHVLLVRHTYAPGWLLPGGGVERGETIRDSAARELREEAAIAVDGMPLLHGVFLNGQQFPGDHIACFVVRQFRAGPFRPSVEIAEIRFCDPIALPDGTSPGTRRRIDEVLTGKAPPPLW